MALSFNIIPAHDCDSIEFQNCSTYCDGNNETINYLIAGISSATLINTVGSTHTILFESSVTTTGTVSTYSWTLGANTGSSSSFTVDLTGAVYTVVLVVTDSNGLTSTCTAKISIVAAGAFKYVIAPKIALSNTTGTSFVGTDTSYLYTTDTLSIDATTDSLDWNDSDTDTVFPAQHTYPGTSTTYSPTYSYTALYNGSPITGTSLAFQIKITEAITNCDDELTEDNIDEVLLIMTDPDDLTETVDITNNFLSAPFSIEQDDLTTLDFSNSGIWNFETIVTKSVDGTNYTFTQCKKIIVKCDLDCKLDKLIADKVGLDKDCVDCEEVKLNQILQAQILMDGLEDHIGCHDTEAINNAILLLESLLANTDCDC